MIKKKRGYLSQENNQWIVNDFSNNLFLTVKIAKILDGDGYGVVKAQ